MSQSSLNCDVVSLIREVDVVEKEGEVLEHPLGKVEVDRRACPVSTSLSNIHNINVLPSFNFL